MQVDLVLFPHILSDLSLQENTVKVNAISFMVLKTLKNSWNNVHVSQSRINGLAR